VTVVREFGWKWGRGWLTGLADVKDDVAKKRVSSKNAINANLPHF
jgi:hypothetical protein